MSPITKTLAAAGLATLALACLAVPSLSADVQVMPAVKGWGTITDPDGDCRVAPKGDDLEMNLPGSPHDYASDIQRQNAPRVLREVQGDFIVEVQVGGELNPGPTSTIGGRLSYHGGGLLLVRDKDNYISLHRGCVFINGKQRHYANFEQRKHGEMAISLYQIDLPSQDATLRLERRGNKVYEATSPDGIHWSSYEPIELELPGAVQVGVVGVSSSDQPLTLRFRDLKVFRKAELD